MRESVGGDEREKTKMIVEKQIPDMDMTENSKTRFFCLSIFSYNIVTEKQNSKSWWHVTAINLVISYIMTITIIVIRENAAKK